MRKLTVPFSDIESLYDATLANALVNTILEELSLYYGFSWRFLLNDTVFLDKKEFFTTSMSFDAVWGDEEYVKEYSSMDKINKPGNDKSTSIDLSFCEVNVEEKEKKYIVKNHMLSLTLFFPGDEKKLNDLCRNFIIAIEKTIKSLGYIPGDRNIPGDNNKTNTNEAAKKSRIDEKLVENF